MTRHDSVTQPRRTFIARLAASAAALTAGIPTLASAGTVNSLGSDASQHDAWMKPLKGRYRQFFHDTAARDLGMLMASNYLDAYINEFGAKPSEVNAVIGVHGPGIGIGLNDAAWAKYAFGKMISLNDPTTKEPAVRNIFATGGNLSVDTLQKRGVVFLMCNTALRLTARRLSTERGETYESIYEYLKTARLPGTILVPALVVAINRAQEKGFTYARV